MTSIIIVLILIGIINSPIYTSKVNFDILAGQSEGVNLDLFYHDLGMDEELRTRGDWWKRFFIFVYV